MGSRRAAGTGCLGGAYPLTEALPPQPARHCLRLVPQPLKSIKYLICTRYKWLIIKIVLALLGLLMLALFLYSLPVTWP